MKEILRIPSHLDGLAWLYADSFARRRWHHHAELELNLVTRGRGSYLLGDRRYDLRPNTLLWLFPEQEHVLIDTSPDYQMWVLCFKTSLLRRTCNIAGHRGLLESNPAGEFCVRLNRAEASNLGRLFLSLQSRQSDAALFNTGLAYAVLESWAAYLKAGHVAGRDVHPAVERAAFVLQNRSEDLDLAEISRRAGLSPSRLSRVFKQQMGVSLVRFRQQQQVEQFLTLYGEGRKRTLLQAAIESGFGSYPQFHRVFKQLMGYGPAEHRRRVSALDAHGGS